MARYPVTAFASHLGAVEARLEADVLRPTAAYAGTRIGARATSDFMRDARGEVPQRRSATDRGPLRIVTGRASNSITGSAGNPDVVQKIEVDGARMTFTKGSKAPGIVFNEDRTAKSGAKLATLRPATEAELPAIQKYGRTRFSKLVTSVLALASAPSGDGGAP